MSIPDFRLTLLSVAITASAATQAAVLPADRADLLYHHYSGDGITIEGSAGQIRKAVASNLSLLATYQMDESSAEFGKADRDARQNLYSDGQRRSEFSISGDYLVDKAILTLGASQSQKDDYETTTWFLGTSQDFFADLSNLALRFAYSENKLEMSTNSSFHQQAKQTSYEVIWTQAFSKNLIMAFDYNLIADEGFLNNPYRLIRYRDSSAAGYAFASEIYPQTRTSHAVGIRGRYYLPIPAAFLFDYRRFRDTWEVDGYNFGVGYTQSFLDHWSAEVHARYYHQSDAEFYSDLFDSPMTSSLRAGDKKLSDFTDASYGVVLNYQFKPAWAGNWVEKATASLAVDFINVDYNNFRKLDYRNLGIAPEPGTEPLYSFNATATRLYVSFWF